MQEWDWFLEKEQIKTKNNYHSIAANKDNAIKHLTIDPHLLFKVVDTDYSCMCGGTCGECMPEDVTFFDLLISYKTLKEKDFADIPNLDWFKLSKCVPLGNNTLLKYVQHIDWNAVSQSFMYIKNATFINLFHEHLEWENINKFDLTEEEVEHFVFNKSVIPLQAAIKTKCLSKKQIQENIDIVIDHCALLINYYTLQEIESLQDDSGRLHTEFIRHVNDFAMKCMYNSYLSTTYASIFKYASNIEWTFFFKQCKPDQQYIENHLIDSISKEGWNYLSTGKIKLTKEFVIKHLDKMNIDNVAKWIDLDLDTLKKHNASSETICIFCKLSPEYIDEHADSLDWYSLCEYQTLTEELMEKHIHRLSWGQISLHQCLSRDFIERHKHRLNSVKLSQNVKIARHAKL